MGVLNRLVARPRVAAVSVSVSKSDWCSLFELGCCVYLSLMQWSLHDPLSLSKTRCTYHDPAPLYGLQKVACARLRVYVVVCVCISLCVVVFVHMCSCVRVRICVCWLRVGGSTIVVNPSWDDVCAYGCMPSARLACVRVFAFVHVGVCGGCYESCLLWQCLWGRVAYGRACSCLGALMMGSMVANSSFMQPSACCVVVASL